MTWAVAVYIQLSVHSHRKLNDKWTIRFDSNQQDSIDLKMDLENQFELCDIQFVKLLNVKIGWNQMTN